MPDCHFTHTPLVPVRKKPDDTSEMITQWLFGEVIDELDRKNQWIFGRSRDDLYEGWFDEKMTTQVTSEWMANIADFRMNYAIVLPVVSRKREEVFVTWLPAGCKIPLLVGHVDDEIQSLDFGILQMEIPSDEQEIGDELTRASVAFAEMMLGAPYLWGGKSYWGIDCSGLTQLAMRTEGVLLPRDSSAQVKEGEPVEFSSRKPGDLAFFKGKSGKVAHVGILDSELKIVHASGVVRRDELSSVGIENVDSGAQTHNLFTLKRYI